MNRNRHPACQRAFPDRFRALQQLARNDVYHQAWADYQLMVLVLCGGGISSMQISPTDRRAVIVKRRFGNPLASHQSKQLLISAGIFAPHAETAAETNARPNRRAIRVQRT